jgi:hypothetical protein
MVRYRVADEFVQCTRGLITGESVKINFTVNAQLTATQLAKHGRLHPLTAEGQLVLSFNGLKINAHGHGLIQRCGSIPP